MSSSSLRLTGTAWLLFAVLLAGCDSDGAVGGDGRIYAGGGYFGQAIALDGDVALVGANDTDEAFVLSRTESAWRVESRLQPDGYPDEGSGGTDNNVLYGWDVGLDGDVAVVGAPIFARGREAEPARAFIYERRGGSWVEAAELRPPTPTPGAQRGISGLPVAVSAGRVAVRTQDNSTPISGETIDPAAVLIYERVEGKWTETARVEETELSPQGRTENFGVGMDLSGDRLAVASPTRDLGGVSNLGVVEIYERDGTSWPLVATLPAFSPETGHGSSVALDGSLLAVAALARKVEGEVGQGSVLIYREAGGVWAYESELRPADLGASDLYGIALAADSGPLGDRVAVGATSRARARGSVFVWVRRPSGTWELEAELWPEGIGAGAVFGEGVAIDGDRLLAGAIYDRDEQGSVYEFRLGSEGWVQVRD